MTTTLPTAEQVAAIVERATKAGDKTTGPWGAAFRAYARQDVISLGSLITAQAAEIERLAEERDLACARIASYTKTHWVSRAEAAEASLAAVKAERDAMWPAPKISNPDIASPTGVPYLDCLIHRLADAQQDINLVANEQMSQPLCDASSLIDEVEEAIRKFAKSHAALSLDAQVKGKHCRQCGTGRKGDTCWKCGSELAIDADGWEAPVIPAIDPIRKLAREAGYAIGVHGSMERDLDLIAAPWADEALDAEDLLRHIAQGINARIVSSEQKPLGRFSATLQIDGWFKGIDISVCPRLPLGDQ